MRRLQNKKLVLSLISGALFGLVAVIGMIKPAVVSQGIIFDGRSIVISIAGFFGGPVIALTSALISAAYRFFVIGGDGKWMGVSVITSSALIGIIFYYLRKRFKWTTRPLVLYLFGVLVHLAMLVMTRFLPAASVHAVLKQIAVPVITIYPLASLLVSMMFLDMEKRIATEFKLRESEEKYRSYVQDSPLGVATTGPDGKFTGTNPKICEMAGYPASDLLRMSLLDFFVPENRENVKIGLSLPDNQKTVHFDSVFTCKDGKEIWCSFSAVKLDNESVLWFIEDISQKKLAVEERFEMQRRMMHVQKLESLGILAGGIAHDFNNILTSALGNIDLALHELPADSVLFDPLKDAQLSIVNAAGLSKQMLAYSGKGKFVSETVDLNATIESMSKLLLSTMSKNVKLEKGLSGDIPKLKGDPTQISQVIMNLVINASEAIKGKDGVVRIKTGIAVLSKGDIDGLTMFDKLAEGEYVCMEVSDNGAGMDEETIARIFEPFFSTKFAGRGLGMAVVLGIVKGHKGAIRIDSKPGTGTVFRVYWPFEADVFYDEETVRSGIPEVHAGSGSILFVDDEDSIRNFAKKILVRENIPFFIAENGREAVELFEKNRSSIRLIVLDMTMPVMDGAETYRKIRKIDPAVRVIVISGYAEEQIARKFDSGIDRFVQKPFSYDTLLELFRS